MFKYIKPYIENMEKSPCERIIWDILPSIRKEFARSLIRNHNLNQKRVAEILKLTPPAVSQYLSNKRGGIEITDNDILSEIDKSARIIFENPSEKLNSETCRICNLLKSKELASIDIKCCESNEILCENVVWNILPVIRKEISKILIENNGFTRKKVADTLGITEAAVSRYLSRKRGNIEITDKNLLKEIQKSTRRIIKGDDSTVIVEVCRICTLLNSSKIIKDKYNPSLTRFPKNY